MCSKKFRKSEKNQSWFLAMFQNQLQKYATKNINQTQKCQTVIYSWHFGNHWIKSFFAYLRQSKMKSRIQNFSIYILTT